jgi:hypothetical protein
MPYIVEINSSYHPGPNWSTFQQVDGISLMFPPELNSIDALFGISGVVEDMSLVNFALRAQFDHVLDDASHEHFMFDAGRPIVSEEFKQMVERIEPGRHQFKEMPLFDFWGQPFVSTTFYMMNIVGIINNANTDMTSFRRPFQLHPDQEFGHLMCFESRGTQYFASDQLAEAWIELCGPVHRMEFHRMSEPLTRL